MARAPIRLLSSLILVVLVAHLGGAVGLARADGYDPDSTFQANATVFVIALVAAVLLAAYMVVQRLRKPPRD